MPRGQQQPEAGRGRGRGGGRGGGSNRAFGSALNPAQLTSHFKNARSLEVLFQTYSAHESIVNHIHLSACWNSLGHLAKSAEASWLKEHAERLDLLVQHTIRLAAAGEVQARQLANIAHGAARTGKAPCIGVLMKALARALEARLEECNAQELANAAWAFAKAGQLDAKLFAELARVVEKRADDFNAQELANTSWAFATAGHSSAQLYTALARSAEWHLEKDNFSAQGLSNTAWAFAKANHVDAQLFGALARAAERRMSDFIAQDIAHTSWAFAKAGHLDAKLFTELARSIEWHLGNFNAQGLSNTAWAFAKLGQLDAQLFTALARSIEQRLHDFNAQDLANTAWAFAKACHIDSQLFAALARSVEKRIDDFNAQDLANTAWAFAKIGQSDAPLFRVLARMIEQRLDDFSAQDLATTAWAFAKADQLDEQLFVALARVTERRLGDFSPQDLANTAWAFANAGQMDAQLFKALARSVEQCLDDLNEEDLDNTAWAFSKAGQPGIVKRIRQRKNKNGAAAQEQSEHLPPADVSKCGLVVVAGGGIGGAAVAVALQSKGFDVTVLESDVSFDARKQGYGLTIQRADAMQALGISLEDDDAPATSHYTFSPEGHILGVFGDAFRQGEDRRTPSASSAGAGRFLHVPRQVLRERLVEQIRPGTIRWNSKLKHFSCWCDDDSRKDNGVTVTLTDGTTLDAALLVGSDGIFSTVRRQLALPGDRLNYLGLIVVLGIVPNGKVSSSLPLCRIFETVDGTTRIYAMPFTSDVTMWQLSFPYAEEAARMLVKDQAGLKAEILRRCGEWHEPVPDLLRSTPLHSMSGYPVYDRGLLEPDMLRTLKPAASASPQRRVTILGDAAHPMSPFRAQGANQALCDAVELADILEAGVRKNGPKKGFDTALPVFEQKMLSRSARMVVGSREKAKELHSSLVLQPARKVQRENGVDMTSIIRTLRARGIGAQSAGDPRGLDALVAEAMDVADVSSECPPALADDKQHRQEVRSTAGAAPVRAVFTKDAGNDDWWKSLVFHGYSGEEWAAYSSAEEPAPADSEVRSRLWGYFDDDWHKCVLLKRTKTGKHKVEWEDGTTSIIDAECIQPRAKKSRNG